MRKYVSLFFFLFYCIASLGLFLYSYTQTDLNLTISRFGLLQELQRIFQSIGYYQRPLSTGLYLCLLAFWFLLYGGILFSIYKRYVSVSLFWKIICMTTLVLVFSYPAFSYDIFNYMFTAKTVLLYHKNPYIVLPRQFLGFDYWVNVMRWIHLSSAYTPLWIAVSLIPYFFGFGSFLLVMWNTKLILAAAYILCVWIILKILQQFKSPYALFGTAVFALNPLVMIESIVNSHNDILMMAIALGAYFLYLKKYRLGSFFLLACSVAVKLMTIFLIPLYLFSWNRKLSLLVMGGAFFLVMMQREVQPWYFLWVIPFVALNPTERYSLILSVGLSLGLLLRYAPFLYFGHWNDPVPFIKIVVTTAPILLAVIFMVFVRLYESRHTKFR